MFVTHVEPSITVPVSEATVLEFIDADPAGRLVLLENLSDANTISYKFQVSTDRSIWTDVAAFTTLAPAGVVAALLTSANNFHRVRAYGNATLSAAVLRHRSFSGVMPLIVM